MGGQATKTAKWGMNDIGWSSILGAKAHEFRKFFGPLFFFRMSICIFEKKNLKKKGPKVSEYLCGFACPKIVGLPFTYGIIKGP